MSHRVLVPLELPDADSVPAALAKASHRCKWCYLVTMDCQEQTPPSAA
ncbi:MAG: hypothetical protein J07HQW2_01007, partial [Haloquadratum walsbyi J07HQW2]